MTCAKRQVFCELYDRYGNLASVGSNGCKKPQEVCPREPGEDYAKCELVCEQRGHAETVALDIAEEIGWASLLDGKAIIYGHHRTCDECRKQLEEAGITRIEFRP